MGYGVKSLIAIAIVALFANNANAEMFGRSEAKYTDIKDFKKWREVLKKQELDMIVNNNVTSSWKQAIEEIKATAHTREEKIAAVNALINNSIIYAEDAQVWARSDYWASPTEAFTKGYGDCEDYAIAKYFSLRMLGLQDEEMRIVVLKDTRKNELHAVLAVDSGDRNYILDNQMQNVMMDVQIAFYQPIYSINQHSWWKHS